MKQFLTPQALCATIVALAVSAPLFAQPDEGAPPFTTSVPCNGRNQFTWSEHWGSDPAADGGSASVVVRKLLAKMDSWFHCADDCIDNSMGCDLDSVTIEDSSGGIKSTDGPPFDPGTFDWDISPTGLVHGSLDLNSGDKLTAFCDECE